LRSKDFHIVEHYLPNFDRRAEFVVNSLYFSQILRENTTIRRAFTKPQRGDSAVNIHYLLPSEIGRLLEDMPSSHNVFYKDGYSCVGIHEPWSADGPETSHVYVSVLQDTIMSGRCIKNSLYMSLFNSHRALADLFDTNPIRNVDLGAPLHEPIPEFALIALRLKYANIGAAFSKIDLETAITEQCR